MRFLLSIPLPLLLILFSIESHADPLGPYTPQEPWSTYKLRLNRSARSPLPLSEGAETNVTSLDDLNAEEVKSRLDLANVERNKLKSELDADEKAVKNMEGELDKAKRDYEEKKSAWEGLDKIAKEKSGDFDKLKAAAEQAERTVKEKEAEVLRLNGTVTNLETSLAPVLESIKKAQQEVDEINDIDNVLLRANAEVTRLEGAIGVKDGELETLATNIETTEANFKAAEKPAGTWQTQFGIEECEKPLNEKKEPCITTIANKKEFNRLKKEAKEKWDDAVTKHTAASGERNKLNTKKTAAENAVTVYKAKQANPQKYRDNAETNLELARIQEAPLVAERALKQKADQDLADAIVAKTEADGKVTTPPPDMVAAKTAADLAYNAQWTAEQTKNKLESGLIPLRNAAKEKKKQWNEANARVEALQQRYEKLKMVTGGTNNTLIYIAVAVVAVLIISGIVAFVLIRKKRHAQPQTNGIDEAQPVSNKNCDGQPVVRQPLKTADAIVSREEFEKTMSLEDPRRKDLVEYQPTEITKFKDDSIEYKIKNGFGVFHSAPNGITKYRSFGYEDNDLVITSAKIEERAKKFDSYKKSDMPYKGKNDTTSLKVLRYDRKFFDITGYLKDEIAEACRVLAADYNQVPKGTDNVVLKGSLGETFPRLAELEKIANAYRKELPNDVRRERAAQQDERMASGADGADEMPVETTQQGDLSGAVNPEPEEKSGPKIPDVTVTATTIDEQGAANRDERASEAATQEVTARGDDADARDDEVTTIVNRNKPKDPKNERAPKKNGKRRNFKGIRRRKMRKEAARHDQSRVPEANEEPTSDRSDTENQTTTLGNVFSKLTGGRPQTQRISMAKLDRLIKICVSGVLTKENLNPLFDDICHVLYIMKELVYQEDRVFEISHNTTRVGDIHGEIETLFHILHTYCHSGNKAWEIRQFVFFGDYVDRGENSTQVMLLLFLLKLRHPHTIGLIRGNHEDRSINRVYGFRQELMSTFGEVSGHFLWDKFNDVFDRMPVCALIGRQIFGAHGGLPLNLDCIDYINKHVPKVLRNPQGHPIVRQLLWADPAKGLLEGAFPDNWNRGVGNQFGERDLVKFFKRTNVSRFERAHQRMPLGYEHMAGEKLCTVFSAANYDGPGTNLASVIDGTEDGRMGIHTIFCADGVDDPNKFLKQKFEAFKHTSCHLTARVEEPKGKKSVKKAVPPTPAITDLKDTDTTMVQS